MNAKTKIAIGMAVYIIMFFITTGYASRQELDRLDSVNGNKEQNHIDCVAAGMCECVLWPLYWPLHLSFKMFGV